MKVSKLALGTAQFGLNYGIANQSGKVSLKEIRAILEYAIESGINTLDTAISYGDSETRLGTVGVRNWKIISKMPAIPVNCESISKWVIKSVEESLSRLKVDALHGLLLHRPDDLNGIHGPELYESLKTAERLGMVRHLGISIYNPVELTILEKYESLKIIQSPLNIIDRRILKNEEIVGVGAVNYELHTRSAFLQGLLLMDPVNRPRKFSKWGHLWTVFDKFIEGSKLTRLEACIRFVLSVEAVSKVIVGIDNLAQLKEICKASSGRLIDLPSQLYSDDPVLINPGLWATIE